MKEIWYKFTVSVKHLNGKITAEQHDILEKPSIFGESLATGKVVRYYENLKEKGKIKDFKIIE